MTKEDADETEGEGEEGVSVRQVINSENTIRGYENKVEALQLKFSNSVTLGVHVSIVVVPFNTIKPGIVLHHRYKSPSSRRVFNCS